MESFEISSMAKHFRLFQHTKEMDFFHYTHTITTKSQLLLCRGLSRTKMRRFPIISAGIDKIVRKNVAKFFFSQALKNEKPLEHMTYTFGNLNDFKQILPLGISKRKTLLIFICFRFS